MKIYKFIFLIFFSLNSKDYKILSLPAGGASGIMNAYFLKYLETSTKKKTVDFFDEIWAASAGSIVAGFLTLPNGKAKTLDEVIEFFQQTFSSYYSAYNIREKLSSLIGSVFLKDTVIPVRVLTGATYNLENVSWNLYGLTNNFSNVLLADAIAASCTVYPYLFRSPYKINFHEKEPLYFIDAGSLCVDLATPDPTAFFLAQFLNKIEDNDTLTVYFLPNIFTQSIDYDEVYKVLESNKKFGWTIAYRDNFSRSEKRNQIEIINIAADIDCTKLINDFSKTQNYFNKSFIILTHLIFEKILGKFNAAANLIVTGLIPHSVFEIETQKIIKSSNNLQILLQDMYNF